LITLGLLAATALAVAGANAAAPSRTVGCPRAALPLTANSISPASQAAFAHERSSSRPQVTAATLAADDTDRGGIAKTECGARVWRRTVVVYIDLRALHPSASLSERVSFVARFRTGYRVWQIVH
jgi:hypothetical protein